MKKKDIYRQKLQQLQEWDSYLLKNSGLPGPRGNLELANAVADEGTPELFKRYRSYSASTAPTNTPQEFLAFCGVLGLGRLLSEGRTNELKNLRPSASDPRWRIREAVAMALQRFGQTNMPQLLKEMKTWSKGNLLERRAAAAALCEPRLLGKPAHVKAIFQILDGITASVLRVDDRRSEDFLALRKGLGYCWSVAVAALPGEGKKRMQRWIGNPDKDIRWIMKENLVKKRLMRVDYSWVKKGRARLEDSR